MSAASGNNTLRLLSFDMYHRHTRSCLPNMHDESLIVKRDILVGDIISVVILVVIVTRSRICVGCARTLVMLGESILIYL